MLLAPYNKIKNLAQKIKYRNAKENEALILTDAVSGSVFWSLTGENLQFTWFDVPPKTNFPQHAHESEQITHVIDGELFFESENIIYKLCRGDSILIPRRIAHRVWTEDSFAKAVDAWSPINRTYSLNQ